MVRSARRTPLALAALLVAGLLFAGADGAAAVPQDETVLLRIGGVTCFRIRVNDGDQTPRQRADRVHVIFAKHLGADEGRFTTRTETGRVGIFLNGDRVINVTDEDAAATGYRNGAHLREVWQPLLEKAYTETRVRIGDGGPGGGS